MLRSTFLMVLMSLISVSSLAEVVLDGRLGPAVALTGPEFNISSDLGQQVGHQLFHSFSTFTLNLGERATFSGDEHLTHIISRVTGGQPSFIDGGFRSTVPQAHLYFLNPAGIIFGPHAQLDLPGSFYVSTADVLHLGDTGQFHARFPERTILSVAPPTAFGFLTNQPASIEIQDSHLKLLTGQALSLIGGDLSLQGFASSMIGGVQLAAESGRINLASVASEGQVTPTDKGLDYSSGTQGGKIVLHNTTIGVPFVNLLSYNKKHVEGGSLFLRSRILEMDNSYLWGTTHQGNEEGIIEVQANEVILRQSSIVHYATLGAQKKGNVIFKADHLFLLDHSAIRSNAYLWPGRPGDLTFELKGTLKILEGSTISAGSSGEKDAGNIHINAQQVLLEGTIEDSPMGTGSGGQIMIRASEKLNIQNDGYLIGFPWSPLVMWKAATNIYIESPHVILERGQIINGTIGGRPGGDITIRNVDTLSIIEGAISSGSLGLVNKINTGDSGNIEIVARQINLKKEAFIDTMNIYGGKAGHIDITTQQITLQENSVIDTMSFQQGNAGNIHIIAQTVLIETGSTIRSLTEGSGSGGSITIDSGTLNIIGQMGQKEPLTGISASSLSEQPDAGRSGEIDLCANHIRIDHGFISTSAFNATGGNITLHPRNWWYLHEGQIRTDIRGGKSDGGNIVVQNALFSILDGAKIFSKAKQGFGGDITVDSKYFLSAADTINTLDASSEKVERSGTVVITAPSEEVDSEVAGLTEKFMNTVPLYPCAQRKVEEVNYFKINLERSFLPPESLRRTGSLNRCQYPLR